ncbi:MAG: hypothetical protein ACKVWR_19500 [Acidimicrobiales bacterium]
MEDPNQTALEHIAEVLDYGLSSIINSIDKIERHLNMLLQLYADEQTRRQQIPEV